MEDFWSEFCKVLLNGNKISGNTLSGNCECSIIFLEQLQQFLVLIRSESKLKKQNLTKYDPKYVCYWLIATTF